MRLVWATVSAVEDEADGLQALSVRLDTGETGMAINYLAMGPACASGQRVLLNTTAVDLSLGTGGRHFVVARLSADAPHGVAYDSPSGGHVMKLRYTPLQLDVMSVESPESPHHDTLREARSVDGMPVVCCGLHSQVAVVAAAVKREAPGLSVAYCMTDEAALSIALSNLVRAAMKEGLIDATVTSGQAFGGDYEAVNLHSAILAARHVVDADVVIAGIGPGVVGTATAFGHGGIAQGEALNAVAAVQGTPVACLRLSFADARPRHSGVSHHTLAALADIAIAPSVVAIPELPPDQGEVVAEALDRAGIWLRHSRADAVEGFDESCLRGVRVTTMGRGPGEDPAFFQAAFAAGSIAAEYASAARRGVAAGEQRP